MCDIHSCDRRYGDFALDRFHVHRTTVSRYIEKVAAKKRKKLGPEVVGAFRSNGGFITLDLWTEDYTKPLYFGLTAHYTNKSQVL